MQLCRLIVVTLLLGAQTACLYTGTIPYTVDNDPPEISNYVPKEDDVLIPPDEGVSFEVIYADPDHSIDQLDVEWFLNGFPRGEGPKQWVYINDLGQDGISVLHVRVTDPAGEKDEQVWTLRAESST